MQLIYYDDNVNFGDALNPILHLEVKRSEY
jgi:hypothetical protein